MCEIKLTEEQLRFVHHPIDQHGRLIAGPGTGKSTAAVALGQNLIRRDEGIKFKILTFTRAATAELSRKLGVKDEKEQWSPSTIHSFSLSLLMKNPGCSSHPIPLRIPDYYEYDELIRRHLAYQCGIRADRINDFFTEIASSWQSLHIEHQAKISEMERATFYGIWVIHRKVFGYTLLQELPDLARRALANHSDLRGLEYDILIVDEYQDLNACDLEVLKRLSDKGIKLLALGDPDQSIYSFRKAHPSGILRFNTDFKTANEHDYSLTECKRSARIIMQWAQYVIQGCREREFRPELHLSDDDEFGTAKLLSFTDHEQEALGVAHLIEWLIIEKELAPNEILVLSRTDYNGAFTKPVKDILDSEIHIPYSDPDAVKIILMENSNRELIAFLHLLCDINDSLAWWTLLKQRSGIGPKFINYIYNLARDTDRSFSEVLLEEFSEGFQKAPASACTIATGLINKVYENITKIEIPKGDGDFAWGAWILDSSSADLVPQCTDSLKELLNQIDRFSKADSLSRFVSQIQPIGEDIQRELRGGVRFMKMRGSKGLTVRATILMGAENGIIPFPGSDPEEERRLLYVAMTRPKEYLFLTWATVRQGPTARSGVENLGRRNPSDLLMGGPVESESGEKYIQQLISEH